MCSSQHRFAPVCRRELRVNQECAGHAEQNTDGAFRNTILVGGARACAFPLDVGRSQEGRHHRVQPLRAIVMTQHLGRERRLTGGSGAQHRFKGKGGGFHRHVGQQPHEYEARGIINAHVGVAGARWCRGGHATGGVGMDAVGEQGGAVSGGARARSALGFAELARGTRREELHVRGAQARSGRWSRLEDTTHARDARVA